MSKTKPSGSKRIVDRKIQVREEDAVQGGVQTGVLLQKIEASDGRNMYQKWDVEVNVDLSTIENKTNYQQVPPSGYAGAHRSSDVVSTEKVIEDGRTAGRRGQRAAARQNISGVFKVDADVFASTQEELSEIGRKVNQYRSGEIDGDTKIKGTTARKIAEAFSGTEQPIVYTT